MFIICDENDSRLGMRLVGVEGVLAYDAEELRTALNGLDADIGVVIVAKRLADKCPEVVQSFHKNTPLLITV
jgi:V/A-type H+-transporting ATPase subunit F